MGAKAKRKLLSEREREEQGNRIRAVVCSEPWYYDCVAAIHAPKSKVKQKPHIERELERTGTYPPPAEHSPMKPCRSRACASRYRDHKDDPIRRLHPPQYVQAGFCETCRANLEAAKRERDRRREETPAERDLRVWAGIQPPHETTTTSPTTVAVARLEQMNAELAESPLPTEDVEVLKKQIARYLAGKHTSLIDLNAPPPVPPGAE